ncbi:hypothetical protein MAPG_03981 [Magnaporthiopsis poae ATCC 64411]|uniref:Solute carrier family 12 member 3 n=1 Tax=Magnaporthiopsis poae (strain ATCC 64411 / 73-15) TaxID=644358 RepID=A0A0C4DVH7_MAGP6|nr:hypothetical protein MAPG_03981 [Magnaporthiopsis poae ATCC 64411]
MENLPLPVSPHALLSTGPSKTQAHVEAYCIEDGSGGLLRRACVRYSLHNVVHVWPVTVERFSPAPAASITSVTQQAQPRAQTDARQCQWLAKTDGLPPALGCWFSLQQRLSLSGVMGHASISPVHITRVAGLLALSRGSVSRLPGLGLGWTPTTTTHHMPNTTPKAAAMDPARGQNKLGVTSGVYIPVCLNILSILMFLRFGLILGRIGLLGMLGLLVLSYAVDLLTTLSLSAVASNGEVKGGGAYFLISRSLGPEFGGSIGILFYLSQVLNTALNVVGLIDCLKLYFTTLIPDGYWSSYLLETGALLLCTAMCLAGSGIFAKASNALLVVLTVAILSIPLSAVAVRPFVDPGRGVEFTGLSLATLSGNLWPTATRTGTRSSAFGMFRDLFGILFPATSGIFAGASMSGDLRNPSKAIPSGTLWAMLTTLLAYVLVILSLAASTTHASLLQDANIIQTTNLWAPIILAGECATTFFSALMGLIGSAKLMQALARDKLVPGLSVFGLGTRKADEPLLAIFLTYALAQLSLFANLNQIATLIAMGYQMTFFVMNLACFLLKIGSAPNFRPAFKFFSWHTAFAGSITSAGAMFFIDETYATSAVSLLVFLFLLIHYLSPPKHWGDVSQNLIYHQVRKYLLRLKPEHIKFWRPQIILLVDDPRRQTRLIQFCNSMKKGALYILGHVIVTDDFESGVQEAKLQQSAWTRYISEYSRIKAFVQLNMSPSIIWGVRNLILSAGLGGMRPNIAVMGLYNMDELRRSRPRGSVPEAPRSRPASATGKAQDNGKSSSVRRQRRRGDTMARLLESELPTDVIRTEERMSPTSYLTILEDLALRYRLNVAVGKGFSQLETPRRNGGNSKKYIDLWPIQMSAQVQADGKNVVTSNFDTYTLILQLGYILHTVPAWKRVFQLRLMVFVEYEDEVEEERQRVAALLEKLRIDAEIHAFSLASGALTSYEAIVHGNYKDSFIEGSLDETLKGEWWDDLKAQRTSGASQPVGFEGSKAAEASRRYPSAAFLALADSPKRHSVSYTGRMGFSMGMHAQNLPRGVFDIGPANVGDSDGSDDSDGDYTDPDFNDVESAASETDLFGFNPSRRPLLGEASRRKSHGDALIRVSTSQTKRPPENEPLIPRAPRRGSYGTVPASSSSANTANAAQESARLGRQASGPRNMPEIGSVRSPSPMRSSTMPVLQTAANEETSGRPPLPRAQSSILAPSASTMLHPTSPDEPRPPVRPAFSRANSSNRFTSSLVPETKIIDAGGAAGRSITFAVPESLPDGAQAPTLGYSEASATGAASDVRIDIPELVATTQSGHHRRVPSGSHSIQESGQSSPGGALKLSFNDLPCRAQHLIINELMQQNSSDTVVLFTTLPIPEEGTYESEEASIEYLSAVEILCHELPPTLMVLSNNMTVTVSL